MNDEKLPDLAAFSAEQYELLAYLLKEEEIKPQTALSIRPRECGASAPLSFAQQRLWFLDQLRGDSLAYNIVAAARLEGRLDVGALRGTLDEIVRRHEILRTTFALVEEQPVQLIAAPESVALPFFDLSHLLEREREAEMNRLLAEQAQQPFRLDRAPLLRVRLLRLGAEQHVLLWVMHHIISDGWSRKVLFQEVAALYAAFARGEESPLAPLAVQYADYAVWQRESLRGEALEAELRYWREQLDGAPALLQLPTDRPRPPVQSFVGSTRRLALSRTLTEQLRTLGDREGTTLFMSLLAAFQVLLARYTGQTDIVVGTPIAGRSQIETEPLIGFFVNMLVLRTSLAGEPSFRELLARVRQTAHGAYEHQNLPFERLVEELQPERELSHPPLFQVLFTLQHAARQKLALPGLTFDEIPVESGGAKFDLAFELEESDAGLAVTAEYSSELFDAATIERMLAHYENLLHALAADPAQKISRLPLLAPPERRRQLFEWNEIVERTPSECLHQLFERQAALAPDRVALTFEDRSMSYGELNASANRLARRLRAEGVRPEVLVGLCLERSPEMLVGVLAVLKAGGAYVPLDPQYPQERLAFMLEDARVGVLVTQRRLLERLPVGRARVVCLDDAETRGFAVDNEENLSEEARPENAAYVIYTSGSTGTPKGVVITHANVVRLLDATEESFGFGAQDVWTLFHSYAFDFSVWEIWGALLYGGRLVVVPFDVSRSPEAFYELLARERVTVLNQTPSAFRQLMRVEDEPCDALPRLSLRLVIFGGEALELQSLQPWFERHGDSRPQLVNMYGITETTVHATLRPLVAGDARRQSLGSPIGRRLQDLQLYVLDAQMQPAPIGVAGELYVGGAGLARGYLDRPELTAERFVPHPSSSVGGARLYRSGDLARLLPGGELEYLGRADEQVKIRGFRVEPGEIEATLRGHEAVRDVTVVVREETPGERRLVAYLVCQSVEAAAVNWRDYLKSRLPDYMLPAAFVTLEQLPLTPSGKLDRRALPAPDTSRPATASTYVAPRNELEEVLAAIWSNVLGLDRVGVEDNFFELGGDSIRSVRVLGQAKERGLYFSLQQLFQHQTISGLVRALRTDARRDAEPASVEPFALITAEDHARLPPDVEDAYPLAVMQAGMLYHMAYLPDQMVYHNVYSYHLRASFDLEAFRKSLRRVAARHPVLRTSFDLDNYSEPLQLVHREVIFPFEAEDIRHLAPEEQEAALDAFVQREKWNRFDFSRPPLIRFHAHRRTDESFNLTFCECHPILDGWSLHTLLAEVFADYFALVRGEAAPPRPPLASAYRDFIQLERAVLKDEECRRFWHDKLADCTILELPAARPLAANAEASHASQAQHLASQTRQDTSQTGHDASSTPRAAADASRINKLIFPLSAELSRELKALARELSVPLKSVLLAAHLKAMSIVGGQEDVLTGLVSVGRPEESDGEGVLGLFFNTLPFRLNLQAATTWRELIRGTFKAELEMLPHRRYPVAALQKQWGRRPLFESIFNYLHFHMLDEMLDTPDMEVLDEGRYWEETNLTLSTVFMLMPLNAQIELRLRYDTTRFAEEQVRAISDYYMKILRAMVEEPTARHDARCFIAEREQRRLLRDFNDTVRADWQPECVHRVFERQVAAAPEALAVVFEDERLSYDALNRRANRLARRLQTLGVTTETLVGLCLERSAAMLVGVLGVLKAGGAYLPLETNAPRERCAAMIAEAPVRVVLTERHLRERLPACEATVVCLDDPEEAALIAQHEDANLSIPVAPANLVYLFFTSGSTGQPKGVAVEHRQLSNYVRAVVERFALPPGASYATVSTFATDLGNTMIYPALSTGGTLHVISSARAADPAALADYFQTHSIDYLKIVPTHLSALLAASSDRRLLPRRALILGGEASGRRLIEEARRLRAPACEVFNHYGPTETTVGVMTSCLTREAETESARLPPLGRPLANTQIYLLDARLHPVPTGVAGEIYVGGRGVARGYFGRPELTAEKFIPHPYGDEPGARLYRTGDLARFLPDGQVEFLKRRDSQVKIRGHRVELGEIEAALLQYPEVGRVAVELSRDAREQPEQNVADARLVAYLTASGESRPTASELRAYLKERLPEHMIPAAFILLTELPQTASGKIDRAALPTTSDALAELNPTYAEPQSELERAIACVWREALQLERVGLEDNLFDLGGHSLILLQIQSSLRRALSREISIVEMFEHPTVNALARHLQQQDAAPASYKEAHEQADARRASLRQRRRPPSTVLQD